MEETNGDKRPLNSTGLYRHKENGIEIWLEQTPGLGSPIIDAFVKAGFVWVSNSQPQFPKADSGEYTESVTKTGATQYRLNGKLISKEQYDSKQ